MKLMIDTFIEYEGTVKATAALREMDISETARDKNIVVAIRQARAALLHTIADLVLAGRISLTREIEFAPLMDGRL